MNIDLKELIHEGIVDDTTAEAIKAYYESKKQKESGSRFFQIISILGIVLVGLGLILIIGYNWFSIPKWGKVTLGFLPLLSAQSVGVVTLFKNKTNRVWSEISATAILAGVAIAISLLSAIYNLDATYSELMKWGLLLCIPVVLVFDSGIASLICWIGVGIYITSGTLFQNENKIVFTSVFVAVLLYIYVKHLLENKINLAWAWHHLAIPTVWILFTFALGPYTCQKIMILHLLILFFVFLSVPSINRIADRWWISMYNVIGFGGTFILAFVFSFKGFWTQHSLRLTENCFTDTGQYITGVFSILFFITLLYLIKSKSGNFTRSFDIRYLVIVLSILILTGHLFPEICSIIINGLLLVSSGYYIKEGIDDENILKLNLGIVILALWVIFRFFSSDIPLIGKGILFIVLGLLCFSLNYFILKKKKS